jgi:hypothetical protein
VSYPWQVADKDYKPLWLGDTVLVVDSLNPAAFERGEGVIVELRTTPHHAVLVRWDDGGADEWALSGCVIFQRRKERRRGR